MLQQPHASASTSLTGNTSDVVVGSKDFVIIGLEDDSLFIPETEDAYEKIINEEAFVRYLFEKRSNALSEYEKAKADYSSKLYENKVENKNAYLLDMAARYLADKRQELYDAYSQLNKEISITEEAPAPAPAPAPAKALSKLATAGNNLKEIIVAQKHGGTKKTLVRSNVMRNHFRTYTLRTDADLSTGGKSFTNNNGKIDWDKFKSQYKASNTSVKLKSQIPWLGDWIKSCNKDIVLAKYAAAYNNELDLGVGAKINFSAEAQFCRAATSLAWTYETDLRKGKFNTKLDGGVYLSLVECKSTASFIAPRDGIMLRYADIYLGIIRLSISISGSAGVGASIAGSLVVDVDASGGKISSLPATVSSIRSTEPGQLADLSNLPGGKVGASASAFAGASIDASIAGAIEWKSPELTSGKDSDFKPLATIKPGLAVTAGIGVEVDYYYDFTDGVFRIFCKSALCIGVGAKGTIGLEVDSNQVANFIICAYHQICSYAHIKGALIYTEKALNAITMLTLDYIKTGAFNAAKSIYAMTEKWYGAAVANWRQESTRIEIMENIIQSPDILKYTIPSAKSKLINMLLDTSFWSGLRWSNNFSEWKDIRTGSTPRKRAIILIFTWVQSKTEFREIMKNIEVDGSGSNECSSWEQGFEIVKEFLDKGERISWFAPYFTSDYDGNFQKFYDRLHEYHPVGYPVIKNDMEEYLTRNEIAPGFIYSRAGGGDDFKEQLLAQAKINNNIYS